MNLKKRITLFILIISIISITSISLAHSGRTDANGGHYDRSTGEYHYHNGGSSYENELIVKDDDNDNTSSFHEYQIDRLNKNILSKQEKIDELNAEIDELYQQIENSKVWHFIYISIIVILIIYIYNIKNK